VNSDFVRLFRRFAANFPEKLLDNNAGPAISLALDANNTGAVEFLALWHEP
jgi:hypothetical protein